MGGYALNQGNGFLLGCDDDEKMNKKASVEAELERMKRLPPQSTYAAHRTRLLNKVLHLMSTQRTHSQNQELELLFAGLSL